jgi:hypothetical protein
MCITRALATCALLVAVGCATGSTLRSGIGDKLLQHAPFYAGSGAAPDTAAVGHLPVAYQRGATQEAMFDPAAGAGTPVAALLAEMTAFLDSSGVTVPLRGPRGRPPDVRFSCDTDPADPSGECTTGPGALGRGDVVMRLAVGRPSPEWVAWAARGMASAGVGSALVITLEVGQYRIQQRGLRGDKEVELGTGYTARLPWLTSLETPVAVLQLTGARIGRDGRAVRIGAEGSLARRTSLPLSALGAQALIGDDEVEQLRTARRHDLPDRPLVWQAALRQLVAELTGHR